MHKFASPAKNDTKIDNKEKGENEEYQEIILWKLKGADSSRFGLSKSQICGYFFCFVYYILVTKYCFPTVSFKKIYSPDAILHSHIENHLNP